MRFLILLTSAVTLAAGAANATDLEAGESVFRKCLVCHAIGEGAANKVGPQLNGVVGREWGAVEGFGYSQGREGTLLAIHEAEPQIWDPQTLSAYLRMPRDVIPRGKMAFAGIADDTDMENLIYYMASFDADGAATDPDAVLAEFPPAE